LISILIVDDHELVRDGVTSLLRRAAGMEVVGAVSRIREALPLLDRHDPDVVLADLSLSDGSGMELERALRRDRRKGRVVILTGLGDMFAAAEAVADGAAGYLLKSQTTQNLLDAIRTVAAGRRYVAPEIASKLPKDRVDPLEPMAKKATGLEALSRRENDVFRQVLAGYSHKDIAKRLCISLKTVETHRMNMNRKLALTTKADLIRLAIANGISVAPCGAASFSSS
jgi:two-component system, NarL family, response regulator NreC